MLFKSLSIIRIFWKQQAELVQIVHKDSRLWEII